jgi:hypothetical protein
VSIINSNSLSTTALSPYELTIRVTAAAYFADSIGTGKQSYVLQHASQTSPSTHAHMHRCLLIVDGASINLGNIKGGNGMSSKNNDILWKVNDKNGEAITAFKSTAYVGGNVPL